MCMLIRIIRKAKISTMSASVSNNTLCEILSSFYQYIWHGNVALLALKVAEWGEMMLQQQQEWMSAVLSKTDLSKGEIKMN